MKRLWHMYRISHICHTPLLIISKQLHKFVTPLDKQTSATKIWHLASIFAYVSMVILNEWSFPNIHTREFFFSIDFFSYRCPLFLLQYQLSMKILYPPTF